MIKPVIQGKSKQIAASDLPEDNARHLFRV